jgi:hypothetical protein
VSTRHQFHSRFGVHRHQFDSRFWCPHDTSTTPILVSTRHQFDSRFGVHRHQFHPRFCVQRHSQRLTSKGVCLTTPPRLISFPRKCPMTLQPSQAAFTVSTDTSDHSQCLTTLCTLQCPQTRFHTDHRLFLIRVPTGTNTLWASHAPILKPSRVSP